MRTTPGPARRLVAAACLAGALAACTSGGDPRPGPPEGGGAPSAGPSPEDVAARVELTLGGTTVTAGVHPLVRVGEHVVATIDLGADAVGEDGLPLGGALGATTPVRVPALAGVRLVDLAHDRVHPVAVDADGDAVTAGVDPAGTVRPGGARLQLAYAAPPPGVEALGLLLPAAPYLAEVPVVDGQVPPPGLPAPGATGAPAPGDVATLDLAAVVEARTVGLDSFTRELEGAVSTLTSTEEVQVTLGSDVLFAVDSAELSPRARAALDVAAARLTERAPGTVDVVGHTDDSGDEAYNQALSERRAAAVAQALAERVDAGSYPLRASGRGELDPVAPNGSDAERALNRRVTLTLASEVTTSTPVRASGGLPPFDGPTAPGPEGVEVGTTRPFRVAAPRARTVDGHLVLDVEVTALDREVDSAFGFASLSGVWHHRGEDAVQPQHSAGGLTVLLGGSAVYPLDHLEAVGPTGARLWLPLTDLDTLARLDGGQTRTFSVLYPEVGEHGTVTVQVDAGLGSDALRLTDVPVEPEQD
ncbi:OmpA family protein [Vallicoccus soli]|uniref:OmpA family protein n=1 Tax=Vallicoccus soli TaxID=2339232 RepID=A0A3A3ZA37_9ACTN|nr:OmpA family protein [Vallicoccus soli]RJK97956.1 OmpA family protein [Vallicoccus soli]